MAGDRANGSGQDHGIGFKGRTRNPLWIRAQTAQTIDGLCSASPRTVTPGDTFEIMPGSTSSRPEEVAIYNVRKFYDGAPLEALFGKPIEIENLNTSSLSRNLDAILFIIALATIVFTLMDAILRERNLDRGATVYRLRIELMNSRMVFENGDWWFEGTAVHLLHGPRFVPGSDISRVRAS